MKALELLNYLRSFNPELILNDNSNNIEVNIFESYNLLIFDICNTDEIYTVSDFINDIESANKNNYDLGLSVWMDIYQEADTHKINIKLNQKDIYLIIEKDIL